MDTFFAFVTGLLLGAGIYQFLVQGKLDAAKSRAAMLQQVVNELRRKLAEHNIPGLTDSEYQEALDLY